jgi:murein DD-endopeptidase MepM/ murein hydrolase activator NlpD
MAAGTIQVSPVGQQPTRDVFSIIGDKVKKAKEQAVEARQEADQRIKNIEEIPEDERTQDDIIELDSLKQKRSENAYFFKKALKFQATDKIRTTMGKFQRDPELQNDPAATEKERFYAKSGMFRPGEMPDMSDREGSKDVVSYVGKGFQLIMDAIDKIKARVNKTASTSEQTASTASSTESKTDGVKNSTENLNNTTETISNVSKEELKVQQMELDFEQQAEQERNRAEAEARSEAQSDTAGVTDVKETDQGIKPKGKGLFSSILNIGGQLLSGRGGGRLGGFGSRGRALGRLGRMRAGRMMNPARRNRQYTAPIGPQPMNSPTPWAAEGGGFAPRMPSSNINLSDGGIVAPIKVGKQKKLADGGITGLVSKFLPPPLGPMLNMMINPGGAMGGIGKAMGGIGGAVSSGFQMLTNPTKLIGDGMKAVLPMNRNVGKDLFGGGDKRKTENITKVLTDLPQIFAGGAMAGFIGMVARSSPILGLILNAAKPVIKPLLDAIGLPASVLGAVFGGSPASAATMPLGTNKEDDDDDDDDTDPTGDMPPGTPLAGGSAAFGSVTGNSGTVAYGGREGASLAVDYSPFSKADIQSKGIQIISGKGARGSRGGKQHKGYDLAAPSGTPLYAYLGGKITRKLVDGQGDGGYGNGIEWKDNVYNEKHFFGHMVSPSPFNVGESVNQGDMLGKVGSTGLSEGPHLHWEIGGAGSQVDPGVWVRNHPLPGVSSRPATAASPRPQPQNRGGQRGGGTSPGSVRAAASGSSGSSSPTGPSSYSARPSEGIHTYYGGGLQGV